jgi:hypothetical protein
MGIKQQEHKTGPMEVILRQIQDFDWITMVILLSLVFLAISKRFFYTRFLNFMILPFNNKYIFMYNKKDRLINGFQVFFLLFQYSNLALFIYLAYNILSDTHASPSLLTYLLLLGGLLIFAVVKIIVQMGNGFVFNNIKLISEFVFKKLSYLNYCGLVMAVANILLTYVIKGSQVVVYCAILLIILVHMAGWITLIKNHQKLITNYFFYFILYLCALEIAPLVLIVNALTY